jgi:hypothetical protein
MRCLTDNMQASVLIRRDCGARDRCGKLFLRSELGGSRSLFPREVWNNEWYVHGQLFIPLVRTYNQPLDAKATAR